MTLKTGIFIGSKPQEFFAPMYPMCIHDIYKWPFQCRPHYTYTSVIFSDAASVIGTARSVVDLDVSAEGGMHVLLLKVDFPQVCFCRNWKLGNISTGSPGNTCVKPLLMTPFSINHSKSRMGLLSKGD